MAEDAVEVLNSNINMHTRPAGNTHTIINGSKAYGTFYTKMGLVDFILYHTIYLPKY